MKSVMSHNFSQIPSANIQRSIFNRSHGYKTTFDSGYLVPIYCDEVLPGDTFKCRHTLFARLATPIVPVMDNVHLDVFYFAVPIRLIWNNFQKFMGEQIDPGDSTDYICPVVSQPTAGGGHAVGSLFDYFGIPTGIGTIKPVAFWSRAYNLIWNEWFRDQNLQDSVTVDKDDGPDAAEDYVLLRRGKRHDYFTSALPWPQKGPAVELPLGTTAPVIGNHHALGIVDEVAGTPFTGTLMFDLISGLTVNSTGYGAALPFNGIEAGGINEGNVFGVSSDPTKSGLVTDLSTATAATINQLREAFQVQKLLERDARGGTRYTEIIRSHFNVISPDARLQRPEYLGGGSSRIIINPVMQTSSTDATTPQGNLAAYGMCAETGSGFNKSFTEHCVILGLVNVRADLTYQQGIPRMFSRSTRYDFYWPELAHLGEQEILNQEIYAQGNASDSLVFGYQERYAEYRYYPSKITGKFRSTYATSLDVWHFSQEFGSLPALNSTFIQDTPPINRVMAVKTEPEILLDCYFDLQCARPMPIYSVPGLIDHF